METKEEILALVDAYQTKFSNEREEVEPLIHFVNKHEGDDLINRKNFAGHLTSSAFIINEDATGLLLLKHKSLNRWLQPGGHVDGTDCSLKAAALREAIEETGIHTEHLTPISNSIFDIDSHHIPENIKKQEPGHIHHDIRFLFRCLNSHSLNISPEESTDGKWIAFSQLAKNEDFYWVEEKIRKLI